MSQCHRDCNSFHSIKCFIEATDLTEMTCTKLDNDIKAKNISIIIQALFILVNSVSHYR